MAGEAGAGLYRRTARRGGRLVDLERKEHVGEHAATGEISLRLLISFPFKAKSLGEAGVNQG